MQLHNRSERHRELFFAGLGVFLMLGLGLTTPPARQDAGQGKTPTTNAQAAARQAESLPYKCGYTTWQGKPCPTPHAPAATGTPICSMIASAKPEHFTRVAPSISRSKS